MRMVPPSGKGLRLPVSRMTLWQKRWWVLAVLAIAALTQGCRDPMKGVALGVFDIDLSSQTIRTELESIHTLGANTVSLPVYWYQQDVTAHEIRPYAEAGFDSARYDDLMRTAIRQAHGAGLGVLLMPVVQLEQTGKGKWRGALQPLSWDAWFDSYERFLLHYARLAEEEGVGLFSVGSELSSAEAHVAHWRALIESVRVTYSGELTYSANWDHYRQVAFWDEVDYLGTSAYYELTDEVPTTYAALHSGWRRIRAGAGEGAAVGG